MERKLETGKNYDFITMTTPHYKTLEENLNCKICYDRGWTENLLDGNHYKKVCENCLHGNKDIKELDKLLEK